MSDRGQARQPDRVLALLPGLLRDLAASNITELEVSAGEARLYLRRRPDALAPLPEAGAGAESDSEGEEEEPGLVAVTAPLSGVYYPAPSPDQPPYVVEGDEVAPGQTVGLIEAMKVFNEIHAESAGTVARILVTPGQQLQSGAVLMKLRPLERNDVKT